MTEQRNYRDPLVGEIFDDKYRIIERLGKGGMGAVYKAEHLLMERTVAIKVIHRHLIGSDADSEQFLRRFRQEARAASQISHPHVVAVYDFGNFNEMPYLVMQYVEGQSLKDILKEKGPYSIDEALKIIEQVGGALAEAHQKSIVHRDLKPDNIMVYSKEDGSTHAFVLDFGIAKILDKNGSGADLTQTGMVVGTPNYVSPEQIRGKTVDRRSDVYSFGIIVYQMLSGRLPFEADSTVEVLMKHINEKPLPLSEAGNIGNVPRYVEKAIVHALQKDPDNRPDSVAEFIEELRGEGKTISGTGFSLPRTFNTETLRSKNTFFFLVLAFLMISGAGIAAFLSPSKDLPSPPSTSKIEPKLEPSPVASVTMGKVVQESEQTISVAAEPLVSPSTEKEPPSVRKTSQEEVEALKRVVDELIRQRNYSRAKLRLKELLAFEPEYAKGYLDLGFTELQLGNMSAALVAYQKCVELKPNSAVAHNNLGYGFFRSGKYTKAIQSYRKATELRPNYTKAFLNLGDVYVKKNDISKAVQSYERARALNPSSSKVQVVLGELYVDLGEVEKAKARLREALQLNPNNSRARKLLNELT